MSGSLPNLAPYNRMIELQARGLRPLLNAGFSFNVLLDDSDDTRIVHYTNCPILALSEETSDQSYHSIEFSSSSSSSSSSSISTNSINSTNSSNIYFENNTNNKNSSSLDENTNTAVQTRTWTWAVQMRITMEIIHVRPSFALVVPIFALINFIRAQAVFLFKNIW